MIGTVRAVYNFPSTDAVEITITDGRQVLVPLRGEVIVSIDRPARCLSVDMDMLDELL
jgi:ribosomal 30S subunit maturation factor RimM